MEILSLIKMNQKIMTIIEIVNKILKNFFIFSHISTYIKKYHVTQHNRSDNGSRGGLGAPPRLDIIKTKLNYVISANYLAN